MTKNQRKFSKVWELDILSEFTTPDEDVLDFKRVAAVKDDIKDDQPFSYVKQMLHSGKKSDIRFLELYDYRDRQRHLKWLHSDPKDLFEISKRRLKQLIALNLRRKINEIQVIDQEKGDQKSVSQVT